jgi:hypothetical protein
VNKVFKVLLVSKAFKENKVFREFREFKDSPVQMQVQIMMAGIRIAYMVDQ